MPGESKTTKTPLETLIWDALQSYRCLNIVSIVDGEPNGGMPLADLLTPRGEETIKLGNEELEELSAHIADELVKHVNY